jgi:MoxR-like ATPase
MMNAPGAPLELDQAVAIYEKLSESIGRAITGQGPVIRHLLSAFLTGGHVLLEDYPGTGKTTLAKALARSVGAEFQRVQFTPDLLPTDILGASVYNQQTQQFVIQKGPIFTNILLADEINRASPRTQSALLEAMGEGQVSLEGQKFTLSDPYFVIATQNPVEFHGTYPLPEAQMDRFALRLSLGYVSVEDEIQVITANNRGQPLDGIEACVSVGEVLAFRRTAARVPITDELKHYLVTLVAATREADQIELGASPRASIALLKCAQALALCDGMDFVTPDLIQELAPKILCHRLALRAEARFSGAAAATLVAELLSTVPVPR